MPHSALDSIRQRLETIRRRQNTSLALLLFGRWLLGCSFLFLVLGVAGTLLSGNETTWRLLFVLWASGSFALSFYFIWRFMQQWQSERHFIHDLEQRLPELEQRLLTSVEFGQERREGVSPQLVDRLFEDARGRVEARPPERMVSYRPAQRAVALAALAIFTTSLLLVVSESFFLASRQLAWPWSPLNAEQSPEAPRVALRVEPGDTSMQRGDDFTVTASLDNATSPGLTLYIQDDNLNWRELNMTPEGDTPDAQLFRATVSGVERDLRYYVEYTPHSEQGDGEQEALRSPQYQLSLYDLPRVDQLEVALDFPDYTGMEDRQDEGGDVMAPEGTRVRVEADLNKSVEQAQLVFESGESRVMEVEDQRASAAFDLEESGGYRIELLDSQELANREPVEYYLRVIEDQPPEVSLQAPGRDRRAMPLEEVPIEVTAEDDYGLIDFELRYSIVGGDQKQVDFSPEDEPQSADGNTLLYLEDLDVSPGDVVSYSIRARDNNGLDGPQEVISDIYFLEVIPTDHQFSRGRAGGGMAGGGGNGGGDSSALVRNQKDVIAATWKLENRRDSAGAASLAEDGGVIRDSQEEVAERAQMSINRLTERGDYADDNYQNAVTALEQAIEEMRSAVDSLDQLSLTEALGAEQRALQAILQAESQVNQTQVAMRRGGGGGGGGSQQQERRELRELFEMEMGELENRYEMPQQGGAGDDNDGSSETLDKLRELARRQEQLTQSQQELARREQDMSEEQRRRQLEKLRREQEELQQDLNQLSQSQSQGSPGGQQSQQSRQSSGGSRGDESGDASQRQAAGLQDTVEQMRRAAESDDPNQAAAQGQKAVQSLRQQAREMEEDSGRSLAELQESAQERSEELMRRQRELRQLVEEQARDRGLGNSRTQGGGDTEAVRQAQSEQREAVQGLSRDLRNIASEAGEDEQRAMQSAHDISRDLRPIRDKMNTSQQVVDRGMLNLSVKLEGEIEQELGDLQQRVQGLGGTPGAGGDQQQVAEQVEQLRQSLEELQDQLQGGSGAEQPDQLTRRQGQRSGTADGDADDGDSGPGSSAGPGRREMERSLERSQDLARDLAQLAAGGQPWAGTARSIRSELTQQKLEAFMNQPELLEGLLQPVAELEKELRVQAELRQIDNKLYSAADEDVPEQYRELVQQYYRVLSETPQSAPER